MSATRISTTYDADANDEEKEQTLRDCFVTGNWDDSGDEENGFGDFEDLEEKSDDDDKDDDSSNDDAENAREEYAQQKIAKKTRFDAQYDESKDEAKKLLKKLDEEALDDTYAREKAQVIDAQQDMNRNEFKELDAANRTLLEGVRPGTYVRVEIRGVPCEFQRYFVPRSPVILGGLMPHESGLSYVRLRVKKHRWFPKILKTNDPLYFSVGWRRFQSMPVYCTEDSNERQRMIKYTPEHMHCLAVTWAPVTPPNTGILAFKMRSSGKLSHCGFRRCAGTGTFLQNSEEAEADRHAL